MLFVAWVAYNGIDQIKWVQNIGSPILIVVMIASARSGHTPLLRTEPDSSKLWLSQVTMRSDRTASGGFALVYLYRPDGQHRILGNDGTEHSDFSRYAKTQKDQFRGQLYGMPLPMAACAFIGAYFSQATKMAYGEAMFDPTGVFYHLDNKRIMIFIAAVGVVAATITTRAAANEEAPANAFSNLAPEEDLLQEGRYHHDHHRVLHPAGMVDLRSRRCILHLDERLRARSWLRSQLSSSLTTSSLSIRELTSLPCSRVLKADTGTPAAST